jgi:uncharacterized protein YoxC
MMITIPEWVLWLLAIPAGIIALALMGLGVMFIIALKDFRPLG